MGMSASQARLLTLTSRLSDLELQAQQISNAKIRLSQKSEAAATTYNNALTKETLEVYKTTDTTTKDDTYISATAYNLTTYGAVSDTDKQRFLEDTAGRIVVSDSVAEAYEASNNNLSTFLEKMDCLGPVVQTAAISDISTSMTALTAYAASTTSISSGTTAFTDLKAQLSTLKEALVTMQEAATAKNDTTTATNIGKVINLITSDQNLIGNDSAGACDLNTLKLLLTGVAGTLTIGSDTGTNLNFVKKNTDGTLASGQQALDGTTNVLSDYTTTGSDINVASLLASFTSSSSSSTSTNAKETYYTNLFNQMQSNGYNAQDSDNMNSTDWLYAQLNSGNLTLVEQSTEDLDGDGEKDWKEVSWSSGDSTLKQDTDDEAIARAEAKYDSEMAEIQTKDKIFDLQLKNIDTEHNAVQTEFDTVKKVIEKNVERSMKLFNA